VPETETQLLRQELAEAREQAARLEQSLIESQRLATVGHLAAQMAHEFKNILMIIMGRAGYALSEGDPDLARKALETAVSCGQRGADIIKSILLYANGREMESRVLPAGQLMEQALDLVAWALPKRHVQLVKRFETDAPVRVVPVRIEQVLLNLVLNACEAMQPHGGRLIAAVEPAEVPGYVALRIQDTGKGIPAEHLERVFDPFFTTRTGPGRAGPCGECGVGLGLPVARDLVRQAGGEIHVASTPGQGSTFSVLLPVVERTDEEPPAGPSPNRPG